MLMTASDRLRHGEEAGFTLVELLIVMVLMGVVGAVTLTSFVSSARSAQLATERLDAINDLTPAMQRMTRDLRAASPLVIDSGGDYTTKVGTEFVRGGVTYRTDYYVEGSGDDAKVLADRYTVESDGTLTTIGTSHLIADVDNDSSRPVFTYFDNDNQQITCTGATQACRDEHVTAARIDILLIRGVGEQSTGIEYATSVNIRNARYGS